MFRSEASRQAIRYFRSESYGWTASRATRRPGRGTAGNRSRGDDPGAWSRRQRARHHDHRRRGDVPRRRLPRASGGWFGLVSEPVHRTLPGQRAISQLSARGPVYAAVAIPRDYPGDFQRTPVFVGCSDVDPYIRKERVSMTAEVFQRMGAEVTARLYPGMGHTSNADEVDMVRSLVKGLTS